MTFVSKCRLFSFFLCRYIYIYRVCYFNFLATKVNVLALTTAQLFNTCHDIIMCPFIMFYSLHGHQHFPTH